MISWVNGKLVTARNKGQLKNYGATAMDTAGVASKFAGRGDIKNAFVFAMKDLSKAVGKLTDAQKEKVFGNGKRWMNLEVIYPASANVIDYDKSEIIFSNLVISLLSISPRTTKTNSLLFCKEIELFIIRVKTSSNSFFLLLERS